MYRFVKRITQGSKRLGILSLQKKADTFSEHTSSAILKIHLTNSLGCPIKLEMIIVKKV